MVLAKDVEIADVVNMDEAPEKLQELVRSGKRKSYEQQFIGLYSISPEGIAEFKKKIKDKWYTKGSYETVVAFLSGFERVNEHLDAQYIFIHLPAEPEKSIDSFWLQKKFGRGLDLAVTIVEQNLYNPRTYETVLNDIRRKSDLVIQYKGEDKNEERERQAEELWENIFSQTTQYIR